MSSMLFLALLIVIISGLIAYVGDLIGRKMGRKRLSLLGLRPRHTAIVISVGMGMLIAALTLGVTFVVSESIRMAFITPISDWKTRLDKLQKDEVQLGLQVSRQEKDLATRTGQLQQANARLTKKRADYTALQARYDTMQQQLGSVSARLAQEQARYAAIQTHLAQARASLAQATKTSLQVTKNMLDQTNEVRRLEYDKQDVETAMQRLQEEKVQLEVQLPALRQLAQTSFTPLVFTSGQEIISGLLPTGGSETSRKQIIKEFFAAADQVVRHSSDHYPADAEALVFLRSAQDRIVIMKRDEAITALARRIAAVGVDTPVIARLAPVNNVPLNGPALIVVDKVELMPNTRVFAAHDEVARIEMEITPSTTLADVLNRLVDDLLRKRVPDALRGKQVVMLTRRYDPKQPAAPSDSQSMLTWSQLTGTAETALRRTGRIGIIARSNTEMKHFDLPELSLHVESIP